MLFNDYKRHYKALVCLGLPIVIGQIGTIVLGVADTLMIGHHSTTDLAAASFVNNVLNMVILLGAGFSYGLTPVVGSLWGKGDHQSVGLSLKESVVANMGVAALMVLSMVILWAGADRIGQPDELVPLIRPYLLVLTASLPLIMLFNAFKNMADAVGQTAVGMWIMVVGNALNIVLNYVLINGLGAVPELGLLGAGLATLISRLLMAMAILAVFVKSSRFLSFRSGFVEPMRWSSVKRLNALGWPIALQMGMETASFSLSAVMMGWLGTIALAAHQVMTTISTFTFMVFYGIGAAVSIRVSYFKGQNDNKSALCSAHAGYHIILMLAAVMCLGLACVRNVIGYCFTSDMIVVEMVAALMIPMFVYQIGDGLQITYANALRGIADVRPMMLMAFIAYFVISLPLGYIFAFVCEMGPVGLWWAFPFGLTSAGIMFFVRFVGQMKR